MSESTGQENANLYLRGAKEGLRGEVLGASELLEILDVFGREALRSYLLGFVEGQADAEEGEV